MRIAVLVTLLAGILCAQTEPKSQQADWRFAHPDATLVGGIRPASMMASPLLKAALTDGKQDPNTVAMVGMAGAMLSSITEIRFSLVDKGGKEPDVIAIVRGTFDESLLGMLGQAQPSYRRLDASTFLFATGPSLDAAAARMTQTTPTLQASVLAGTDALLAHDFWLSGNLPEIAGVQKELTTDIRGLAFGLSMHDAMEGDVAIKVATPALAEALLETARREEAQQPVEFRGMFQSFVEGSTAHFHVNVPRESVLAALRARTAAPPPQPPPRIRIEGLDDGPRVIELK